MRTVQGSWLAMLLMVLFGATPARAQLGPDGIDPGLITGERQFQRERAPERPRPPAISVAPSAALPASPKGAVLIGAITITGLQRLSPADFADIVATHLGQALGPRDLAGLADAVAQRMRARGYLFATATIAVQRVEAGVLQVVADEGAIDEIRFDGPVSEAVRADLAPLVATGPVTARQVERRLLIAGDNSGARIRSSRFLRERGRGVLLVSVAHDPAAVRLTLSNQGTRTVGPVQVRIDADLNGLIDSRDRLSLTASTTPLQPAELQFARIRYARDLGSEGTEVALSATASATRPGSYLAPFAFRTRSWAVAAGLNHPLVRRRSASLWVEGEFGLRTFQQWREDNLLRRDRLTTARLTLYGNARVAGGQLRMSASLTQGLGWLGATQLGDPLAPRSDADGTYTALSGWGDWTTELGHGLSLRLAAQGQLAAQPLPLFEELTLGGSAFLRGYDWGERSGDEGAVGLAELRYLVDRPLGLVQRAQLYAFADGGVVSNRQDGPGGGALASAGGGLRVDLSGRMGATMEVAVPLSGPRYDTGTESPRVNLGLIQSF
ncbi:ShlB/FhaC/HecB family hemolysin secretion/activation protein [Novosphingobium piscinae]|uniref:ShlB/FhaC/HecB family hemolysin secretion/activation protein n=1 Tax=Novosphingobium piscinae TaxID=1507448 RepID=A0A7X1G050_9SPHN|nr:ShlB/FhaC/HecB family hemolysin secretion/activation protein [Novosphingobium piscinae]MBC2669512.1 ShlB/FhaC/HecB family hemolysin secretion/activation protein [Novosphingobium piscinae]